MTEFAIETNRLRKTYRSKVAVADLSLQVPRGEVFGFLGPNGAGKSSSVKMLLGLVKPSAGVARVLGQPPGHTATKKRVGFLPEHFRFHEWLPAAELLDFHGRLYGMEATRRKRRIAEVLEQVGLAEQARRPLSTFSKGMLQRIGLAQALLNEPELIFLDEPTSGLDPFGVRLVRQIIHDLKARGTTIFLNSHLLGEVEITCDRVSFIKEGVVLRTVAMHELATSQLRVELRVDAVSSELLSAVEMLAQDWHFLDEEETLPAKKVSIGSAGFSPNGRSTAALQTAVASPTRLELVLDNEDKLPEIAQRVLDCGAKLYALTPRRVSLEQLFLEIVGKEDSGQ
jgi:ABC-2 type transport system ATP-binding protein